VQYLFFFWEKDMARVLELDDCHCDECPYTVAIGNDLHCPILGCVVKRVTKCQVGIDKTKYDEEVKLEIESELEESIHQCNYLQDSVSELNEMIEKLEDENQTLKAALSIEEMIKV
jgi:hypothetical protein